MVMIFLWGIGATSAGAADLTVEGGKKPEAVLLAANLTGTEDDQDREEMLELLAVLDEETKVATKTKMNNDYVPGMVSVLHGDHLEALGIHTVAEALSLVPGIQMGRITTGEPTAKVRGVAYPFNAGNIKVMLNSIALSRESSGINSSVLLTPVAQVERIEIIRGPGSIIYGDFAVLGLVNIITRKTGGRVFGSGGSDDSYSAGGHYTYRDEDQDFTLGANISVADGGESAASQGKNPEEERVTGVFNFNYKKFTLTAEGVQKNLDLDMWTPPRPPPNRPRIVRASSEEDSWAIEGRQVVELSGSATVEAYLSYLQNSWDSEIPLFEFKGDRVETGLDLGWSPWARHEMLFSFSYAHSEIDDAVNQPPMRPGIVVSGLERHNYSFSIQDQVDLSEQFVLTLGLRFDDYNDVGSNLTPRIAGVYRLGEHHVIKAQYSEGFRAPTFWELYNSGSLNEQLEFEVNRTTELAYIYRRPEAVARITGYYSEIDGSLLVTPGGSGNNVGIDSKGVEMEWEQQINAHFRWLANISYNDTSDGRNWQADNTPIGVADWLGNLAFYLKPAAKFMLTGRLLYVGDRHIANGYVGGYSNVDFTLSRMDLVRQGITLRVGIKNLCNDANTYLTERLTGLMTDEFQGRTGWMQLSYDF